MKKELVSIIIVNWNGKEHLSKCLPSLGQQSYKNVEVIVVDNGSTDHSVRFVKKNFPSVRIVQNKTNLGFAEGNNEGYKVALGEYILFLNNDTTVTKNFITELLKVLTNDKKIGGVQSKILFMDVPTQLDSVGSYFTNTGFLYHYGVYAKDSKKFDKQISVYSAKGACMMFKKEVLEGIMVNGEIFDNLFFAYFEETDLCHRVWLSGYEIVYVPKSVIYHKFGATSTRLRKPFIEYHSYKNRINSYLKNLGVKRLLMILSVHLSLCIALSFVFLLKGRHDIFLAIHKAIIWNIKNARQTLAKRNYIQSKIRKITDDELLSKVTRNQKLDYYLSMFNAWNVTQVNAKK